MAPKTARAQWWCKATERLEGLEEESRKSRSVGGSNHEDARGCLLARMQKGEKSRHGRRRSGMWSKADVVWLTRFHGRRGDNHGNAGVPVSERKGTWPPKTKCTQEERREH